MAIEVNNDNTLASLLERLIQMNAVIIEEMHDQRKRFHDQQSFIFSQLPLQSSQTTTTTPATTDTSVSPSSRLINKINIKPKEYNGTTEENVLTWLLSLEEIMGTHLVQDEERLSLAISLLGGTALQWFINLKVKNQRPSTWNDFKTQLISQFQPVDFQENLRQQLLKLWQKHSLHEYIHAFRNVIGQINSMDELTQVMLFINGLSINNGLYVRSKHPQTLEAAIREATTYDNVMTVGKDNNVKYDPFLETSTNIELNHMNGRQQQRQQPYKKPFNSTITKDDCFKFGLCFYCKESGHRAIKCPKKAQQRPSTTSTSQKND